MNSFRLMNGKMKMKDSMLRLKAINMTYTHTHKEMGELLSKLLTVFTIEQEILVYEID